MSQPLVHIMRHACLQEDEGSPKYVLRLPLEEARAWITNQNGYFNPGDFYILPFTPKHTTPTPMNQDILIRIIRAAALAVAKECETYAAPGNPSLEATTPVAQETEAPKPKATRAKKVEAPPAPVAPEPVAQPAPEPAAETTNVVDFIPEAPIAAAPASKVTIDDIKAYAYTIGKKANGGVATEAGTKARNWLKKNFDVEGIDAIPNVGDNYDRVLEMLIKVGATDSRLPATPPAPEDEL